MPDHAPAPGDADPLGVHGVVPPTVTAFHADESLDADTTAAHARYVVDRGAHGVFPLGTNGEFALLTGEERQTVVAAVVDEISGDVPVIAGVGAPSTHETIQHAEHAESVGADGIVVVTPYYYPLDRTGAVTHYRRVADAVDLPVYVYHIPSKTGNALSLDTLADLAAIENVVGLKDSSKDVPWLGQAIDRHSDLTFLSGSDS
ncbi:MAG: dihydrodipicolinate synthase family protein, partial [Haloplanus sp.]